MVELWGTGIVECCNIGTLEWWNGRNALTIWILGHRSIIPSLHYSILH